MNNLNYYVVDNDKAEERIIVQRMWKRRVCNNIAVIQGLRATELDDKILFQTVEGAEGGWCTHPEVWPDMAVEHYVMAPRLPHSMVARPSAPTDSTLAEVAEVLPQPVSNCRSPISGSVRPFGRGTAEFGHDLAQACRQEHLEGDVFHEPRQLCKLLRSIFDSVERSAREVSPVDRHRS